MPIIVIDGCEKVGKTTVIEKLIQKFKAANIEAERVHWTNKNMVPDDRAVTPLLIEHSGNLNKVWLWDRGWPSEYVYGRLLGRDHRMTLDPWIGEWLHGRAVQANGLRVILTGPPPSILRSLRDATDLPVSAADEQSLFIEYGQRFGWEVIFNLHTELDYAVEKIFHRAFEPLSVSSKYQPPAWSGPTNASIVIIGSNRSNDELVPGGWLPFTRESEILFAREFGDLAFKVAWVNLETCDPLTLKNRNTIITCGSRAAEWFNHHAWDATIERRMAGEPFIRIVNILDPLKMFTFKDEQSAKQLRIVRSVIESLKPIEAYQSIR